MGLELVTTFHAARPPLMWSIEPKTRATLYGSEKLVETVAPSPIWVVQAASAVISVVGSKRHRNDGWSVGSIAIESEMNSRSNLPALGDAGDLLHHRQFHVGGEGAVGAPAGHVVAGAEDEDAEMHLTAGRGHGALASWWWDAVWWMVRDTARGERGDECGGFSQRA